MVEQQEVIIFANDLGGTNARMQLCSLNKSTKNAKILANFNYKSQTFKSYSEIMTKFFNDITASNLPKPTIGVCGLPGVVSAENVVSGIANLPYDVDGNKIKKEFNLDQFVLENDSVCLSNGVNVLQESDLINLNDVKPTPNKMKVVMTPGTGLGVSFLIPQKLHDVSVKYVVWQSEAAHANFAPQNQSQIDYMNFCIKQDNLKYLYVERAFCGKAVPNLYKFICQKNNIEQKLQTEDELKGEYIFDLALKGDAICKQVLDFFIEMFANELSNIAIATLCTSGIFISGSIIKGIADYILKHKEQFINYYLSKYQNINNIIKDVPIFVIKDDEVGQKGVLEIAKNIVFGSAN